MSALDPLDVMINHGSANIFLVSVSGKLFSTLFICGTKTPLAEEFVTSFYATYASRRSIFIDFAMHLKTADQELVDATDAFLLLI